MVPLPIPFLSLLGTNDKALKHSTGNRHYNPFNNPSWEIYQETEADCYRRKQQSYPWLTLCWNPKLWKLWKVYGTIQEAQKVKHETTGNSLTMFLMCYHTKNLKNTRSKLQKWWPILNHHFATGRNIHFCQIWKLLAFVAIFCTMPLKKLLE